MSLCWCDENTEASWGLRVVIDRGRGAGSLEEGAVTLEGAMAWGGVTLGGGSVSSGGAGASRQPHGLDSRRHVERDRALGSRQQFPGRDPAQAPQGPRLVCLTPTLPVAGISPLSR